MEMMMNNLRQLPWQRLSEWLRRYGDNVLLAAVCLLGAVVVMASTSSSTEMPWDDALSSLQESLTGPFAYIISLVGIVASAGALVFGGEISGFLKSMIYVVLVVAVLIGANAFMTNVMGASALLPAELLR